ncbi:MAG: response regulator [Flavobacteriales bacterium]|jgi:DNA-binding NarL/FixJ family response regulator
MGIRVTVVEDDEVLRNAICEAVADDARLELVGQYRDAEGFLERVAIDGPEVVIMDIGLPGIDGVTAMRKVKAKLPEVQFLVSTVQDDDDHLYQAICSGATGYLVKGAAPEQVVDAVCDMHAGGSPMSPGIARRVIKALAVQHTPAPEIGQLTERERQVLDQLAQGYRYKEIAVRLSVSVDTVRTHVRNLYEKLHVSSRTDALNKLYPR